MEVDMSAEAVTQRMTELNQLWELAVALQSSDLASSKPVEERPPAEERQKSEPD